MIKQHALIYSELDYDKNRKVQPKKCIKIFISNKNIIANSFCSSCKRKSTAEFHNKIGNSIWYFFYTLCFIRMIQQ